MKMHCPHCGVKGSVDDSYIDRRIKCPKCQEMFRCQTDEAVSMVVAQHEPIPRLFRELPATAPTDERADEESLTEVGDQSPRLLPEAEQPDHKDTPISVVSQDFDTFEVIEEVEGAKVEVAEAVPAAETFPDIKKVNEGEELEALLTGEVEVELVEEAPEEPAEERAAPEMLDQEISTDTGRADSEKPDEQEPLRLEDDSPPPAPEPVLPAAAVAAEQVREAKEPPAASVRFVHRTTPRTDFTMGEALNDAWRYTKGAKGSIWAAVGMMYLVMLILGLGLAFMQAALGVDPASAVGIWAEIGVQSLVGTISTLFTAGLMYLGVRRATEKNFSWKMVFAGFEFSMALKLLIASIFMTILVICGFVLLILPGIYLAIGYTMTLPLIIDRQLDPWQAMEASRKAIHKVWWKVFGLFFVMGLIYCVSAIPLGIGLIWTVPMSVILVGVVYRYLFGGQAKKI